MPKQQPLQVLGEQLTGLSPTVCRRAIAAIRKADEDAGGEKRTEDLPEHCHHLLSLLTAQLMAGSCGTVHPSGRNTLLHGLAEIERFLDIVEGVELKETPAAPATTDE